MIDRLVLQVKELRKAFGGVLALNGVNFSVSRQQVLAIIGPNGAGKTTLFNLITGIFPSDGGSIEFLGKELVGLMPYQIASVGVARTFQNLQLFGNMSVIENVMAGLHSRTRTGILSAAFRLPWVRIEEQTIFKNATGRLRMVGLEGKFDQPCSALPLGQQRLLEIARALAMEPVLLLLDEPMSGLSGKEKEGLANFIFKLRDEGLTILLIGHDMKMVMGVADRVVVLDQGSKIAEGVPKVVKSDPKVIAAYLGEEVAEEVPDKRRGQNMGRQDNYSLVLQSVITHYGAIQVLKGISMEIEEGGIVTIIGANGAGKSTLLNTISGIKPSTEGKIIFKDQDITRLRPEEIVKRGISHVPERRQIFSSLTVRDNLILGAYTRYVRRRAGEIGSDLDHVFSIFPILKEKEKELGGNLSGGQQQMLAIGRGLMARPKLLLLDEPSLGLAPLLVKEIMKMIRILKEDQGITILLVEQNARAALKVADCGYVLEIGEIVLQGKAVDLLFNPMVETAYLG